MAKMHTVQYKQYIISVNIIVWSSYVIYNNASIIHVPQNVMNNMPYADL